MNREQWQHKLHPHAAPAKKGFAAHGTNPSLAGRTHPVDVETYVFPSTSRAEEVARSCCEWAIYADNNQPREQ